MKRNKYQTNVAPFLKEIGQMARDGATEAEIAGKLNVAYSTFKKYKSDHEELRQALAANKEMADLNVEAALYRRATGFEYDEVTQERRFNRQTGEFELVTTKTVTKTVPPDTTAQIFFLKNRRPDKWRDKQTMEISAPIDETAERIAEILNEC